MGGKAGRDLSFAVSFSKCPQQPVLEQDKARSLEFHPGLLHWQSIFGTSSAAFPGKLAGSCFRSEAPQTRHGDTEVLCQCHLRWLNLLLHSLLFIIILIISYKCQHQLSIRATTQLLLCLPPHITFKVLTTHCCVNLLLRSIFYKTEDRHRS